VHNFASHRRQHGASSGGAPRLEHAAKIVPLRDNHASSMTQLHAATSIMAAGLCGSNATPLFCFQQRCCANCVGLIQLQQ
jgi:hypothetical protein